MTEVELSARSGGVTGGYGFDVERYRRPWLYPDNPPHFDVNLFPRSRRVRSVAHDWRWRFVYAWRALRGDDFADC